MIGLCWSDIDWRKGTVKIRRAWVMGKMKATPINDFSMKNVRIREDGQTMRPVYAATVKTPGESKGKYDYYTIKGEIAGEQVFRPLAEGGCDFVKK